MISSAVILSLLLVSPHLERGELSKDVERLEKALEAKTERVEQLQKAVLELADEVDRLKEELAACEADVDKTEARYQQAVEDFDYAVQSYEGRIEAYRRSSRWRRGITYFQVGGAFAAGYALGDK